MSALPPSLAGAEAAPRAWCVQEIEGRGRGVVSTEAIPGGTVVLLESRPLVAVVHASRSRQACANCFCLRLGEVSTKFLPHPVVCATCQQAVWCSEECKNQSTVLGTHPSQICLAYQRLGQLAEEDDDLDAEMQSDARLLFYAYFFRRYRPEEFARWSLLCSVDTHALEAASHRASVSGAGGSSAQPAGAAAPQPGSGAASATEAEEEARIETLHDAMVECLQFAAKSIADPAPLPTPVIEQPVAELPADPLAPPPALALPSLAKQFTDLHISHPSDDLTQSLALDADLAVTRSLYLKTKCNGFALMAPNDKMGNRQTPRGYAIYTNAAMVNHSCLPNVARFDKIDARDVKYSKADQQVQAQAQAQATPVSAGASSSSPPTQLTPSPAGSSPYPIPSPLPSPADCSSSAAFTPLALELRTMTAVPAYTELTLAYVPLFWDRSERQAQLRGEYGFKCRCDRCRTEKRLEREERAAEEGEGREEEEEEGHEHCHDDEEEEDGEDDEDGDDEDDDGPSALSEDDADDLRAESENPAQLTRGQLNIWAAKYVCPSKVCGGTMAPMRKDAPAPGGETAALPAAGQSPAAAGDTMECNICGKARTDAQFHRQLAKEFGPRR